MLFRPICADTDTVHLCNMRPDRHLQAVYTIHEDNGYSVCLARPYLHVLNCAVQPVETS